MLAGLGHADLVCSDLTRSLDVYRTSAGDVGL
jgi:hypothetical protein